MNPALRYAEQIERDREAAIVARKAAKKAMRLLNGWLTAEQRHEFKMRGHFHVIGGETKRRYRIKRGAVMNVIELDAKGKPLLGHCFTLPGQLPDGDVMLAQKLALELQEYEALAKANVFEIATIDTTEVTLSFLGITIREVELLCRPTTIRRCSI